MGHENSVTPRHLATDAVAKNCRGLGEFYPRRLCGRCVTKPTTAGQFRQQWPAHCCRNRRVVFFPPEIPQRATSERAMAFRCHRKGQRALHDGGCARQNSTNTAATDPTMVSPGRVSCRVGGLRTTTSRS